MTSTMSKATPKNIRIGFSVKNDVRKAMLVVRDNIRVLPSHQVDLAMREYMKQYEKILKENGIKL